MLNRKLHVLDATVGEVCRTFDAVHDKAIHCIGLPQPSLHVNQSADCYNFFTTSATDNKISLWDLRTAIPIGQLSGHVNTREYVGAAISPCLKVH